MAATIDIDDASRWPLIDKVFTEALDLDGAARSAYLDEACGTDAVLRRQVENLLAASDEPDPLLDPGGALDGPLWADAAARWLDLGVARPGQRIGAYRIVDELGAGGMAEVYLAERADEQFEQKVALKLVRPGWASDEVIDRFRQERQIVASLNHRHIARLYDGGVTADGRPYFAMEYVRGAPVHQYCDEQRLTIDDRLVLFLEVARAVHYAHGNLLVHRDLKPSNILVTADGEVKLLDFGIAKLLDPDAAFAAPETRSSIYWMTPDYASPEQLRGESVTTATDQYQLGLLLFRLLTGRNPYRFQRRSLVEVLRAVTEQTPERPSMVVDDEDDGDERPASEPSALDLSLARQSTPARLRRRLRGDLDAIVLKALAKAPEDRFASVGHLVVDVERHLVGLPVAARPDTLAYRARAFIGRHRLGVAVAAAFLLLIAFYATTITHKNRQVVRQRDLARATAQQAEQVKNFLVDLFEYADPEESRGDEVTVRQVLDRGARRLDELAGLPEVQAEMKLVIGRIYSRLGDYDRGRRLLEEALQLYRRQRGTIDLQVAQTHNDLAGVLRLAGEYRIAAQNHRQALAIRQQMLGEEHAKVSGSLHNLGLVLEALGEYGEAEELLRRALAIDRQIHGHDFHRDVSFDLSSLGDLLGRRGRFSEAEALLRQSLDIRRRLLGARHPLIASTLRQLAALERQTGDLAAAERSLRQALEIHHQTVGEEHREMALDLVERGKLHLVAGELEAAEAVSREAEALLRRLLGEDHRQVALVSIQLGRIDTLRGNGKAAIERFRAALGQLIRQLSDDHPEVAEARLGLGQALAAEGTLDEAQQEIASAIATYRDFFGNADPRTLEAERVQARVLLKLMTP